MKSTYAFLVFLSIILISACDPIVPQLPTATSFERTTVADIPTHTSKPSVTATSTIEDETSMPEAPTATFTPELPTPLVPVDPDQLLTISASNAADLQLVRREAIPASLGQLIATSPSGDLVATIRQDLVGLSELGIYSLSRSVRLGGGDVPIAPGRVPQGHFSPAENSFAVLNSSYLSITVWDRILPDALQVVQYPVYGVDFITFHPGGRLLAAGTTDSSLVQIWNLSTHQWGETFQGEGRQVLSLAFSTDGVYLASGGDFGFLRVWRYSNGDLILAPNVGDGEGISALAFDPSGQNLALGMASYRSPDSSVQVWSLDSGVRLWTEQRHRGGVTQLAFNPDGRLLASTDLSGELFVWSAESGELLKRLSLPAPAVEGLSFSRDGKMLLVGTEDGDLLWYGAVAQ